MVIGAGSAANIHPMGVERLIGDVARWRDDPAGVLVWIGRINEAVL
jgi:hypothetical protein